MKFMKRAKIYKANNLTFDPQTMDAHSYVWWRFVAKVDGVIIFNNYRYSSMTTAHQWKVRRLLNELNIKIDIEAPFARGISDNATLSELYIEAEETLCDLFIENEERRIRRNERAKYRRDRLKVQAVPKLKLVQGGN